MNINYIRTYFDFVSQCFNEVFKTYEEENLIDETQSPVHVPVHAFESPVKRNWSRYEDDTREVAEET